MHMSPVEFAVAYSTGLLAVTFLVSGLAKAVRPSNTVDAMRALRVPAIAHRVWVAVLVAVWELGIVALLLFSPPPIRAVALTAAAITLAIFTVLLVGVLRRGEDVDCGCFGPLSSDEKVSIWSVFRNVILIVAAAVALLPTGDEPFFQSLSASPTGSLLLLSLAWALTVVLLLVRELIIVRQRAVGVAEVSEVSNHLPVARMGDSIPDAEVVTAEGVTFPLGGLGGGSPVMLVFMSAECSTCATTSRMLPEWAANLAGVRLRVATSSRPDQLAERMPQAIPFAVYGAKEAKRMFGAERSPAAVLLGGHAQPVVASPLVYGANEIEGLVRSIVGAQKSASK